MPEGKQSEMQFTSRTKVPNLYIHGCMFDIIDMFYTLQFTTSNSSSILFLGRHEFYVYIFCVR